MRLRLILSNVAVIAVSLLVALIIGEVVLRISPSPALQAASESGPLSYFPANVHITAAGHQAAADAVAAGLAALTPTN